MFFCLALLFIFNSFLFLLFSLLFFLSCNSGDEADEFAGKYYHILYQKDTFGYENHSLPYGPIYPTKIERGTSLLSLLSLFSSVTTPFLMLTFLSLLFFSSLFFLCFFFSFLSHLHHYYTTTRLQTNTHNTRNMQKYM